MSLQQILTRIQKQVLKTFKFKLLEKTDKIFSIDAAAAEKKYKKICTAYGQFLKTKKNSVRSGSGAFFVI